ncbi:membrane protein [Leptomonas pyrrhocoris]|uniref:Membrane protein n=1 Tax=Leptomonas pyrrhocoris TaxID=157538 RepID=A0A0N0DR04_LEPPY|nr:membrane protein [Leptomonas pyrrhocoris]KPA73938.1 membrane protein [Leptomonas pyrrhocoris]|eukprot:XP_015652377.1 membrane protein [Leptomonas pyrrhocoris]
MQAAQSAAYLSYHGTDAALPLEKYVAVSAVAAALCEAGGGCGVLNVHACTAASASLFSRSFIEENCDCAGRPLDFFRALPVTTLYAGFQPYQTEGAKGELRYGFRTHGAELLGLPNLATFATDVASSEVVFYAFHAMWELMQRRGRPLVAGEPVQLTSDPSTGVTVRDPLLTEAYLQHPPQGVLVLEPAKGWEAFQALTRGASS